MPGPQAADLIVFFISTMKQQRLRARDSKLVFFKFYFFYLQEVCALYEVLSQQARVD